MAINVTAQKFSQALRGESVMINLNAADSANLKDITIGQKGTLGSNSKVGYVCSVDEYGHSFKMNPEQPNKDLASDSTSGYLAQNETITLE